MYIYHQALLKQAVVTIGSGGGDGEGHRKIDPFYGRAVCYVNVGAQVANLGRRREKERLKAGQKTKLETPWFLASKTLDIFLTDLRTV